MADLRDLMRDYERARYPSHRQLDLQAEGPRTARERALSWIQSRAHEEPGQDLLLVVSRGSRPGLPPGPVEQEIRKLLGELEGKLVDWWQPFAPGSLAFRIAAAPSMRANPEPVANGSDDGRTSDTAGAARPLPINDIPPELFSLADAVVRLRMEREELSARITDVVLREVWIEAQAQAMEDRLSFAEALERLRLQELDRLES